MQLMNKEQKKKVIEKALKEYTKNSKRKVNIGFGKIPEVEYLPTPFTTLNTLMNGGPPKGKFGVVAGPERVGKTTLILQIIAYNQAIDSNFVALWTDAENVLDKAWCIKLGVDLERLIIQRYPDAEDFQHMEEILEEGLSIIRTHAVNMWVIDSLGALVPKAEIDKTLEENTMLVLQRKLGEFFRKANNIITPTDDWDGCSCVFIGQVYSVPTTTGVGIEEVRGGNAVKHWAYWRLRVRRAAKDNFVGDIVNYTMPGQGKTTKKLSGWPQVIKLEKTKMNDRELEEIMLQFKYGRGLDAVHCSISALLANEVIIQRGAYYYDNLFPEGKIHGKEALFIYLTEHEEIRNNLVNKLDNKLLNFEENTYENGNTEGLRPDTETT